MNQKLFQQIGNEWRSNVWLCVELLVVSVVLWFIVDTCYVMYTVKNLPKGFDVEHCYKIDVGEIDCTSPEFVMPYNDSIRVADRQQLLERLRRRPEVEAAAFSTNSHPYQGSNSGGDFRVDSLKTTGYSILRRIQPDFIRVFRIEGADGESPEQLAEKIEGGGMLVSQNLFERDFGITDMRPYVGKGMYMMGDSTNATTVQGVFKTFRYNDYTSGQMNRSVLLAMSPMWIAWSNELTVRVRDNMDNDFIEKLVADAPKQLRVGNQFVRRVQSFKDIRENVLLDNTRTEAYMFIGMGFLMLNIFLGLLGTFWFRTQQRVQDLAVRRVSGATRTDVYSLLVGEGLILLAIVTPLAVLIDVNIAHLELNSYYNGFLSAGRMALCSGITFGLMALMIVAGISIPASRAMRIEPADALRDE